MDKLAMESNVPIQLSLRDEDDAIQVYDAVNLSVTVNAPYATHGGSQVSGDASAVTVSGVGTFSNVKIDKPGKGYTLTIAGADAATQEIIEPFTTNPFHIQLKLVSLVDPVHTVVGEKVFGAGTSKLKAELRNFDDVATSCPDEQPCTIAAQFKDSPSVNVVSAVATSGIVTVTHSGPGSQFVQNGWLVFEGTTFNDNGGNDRMMNGDTLWAASAAPTSTQTYFACPACPDGAFTIDTVTVGRTHTQDKLIPQNAATTNCRNERNNKAFSRLID